MQIARWDIQIFLIKSIVVCNNCSYHETTQTNLQDSHLNCLWIVTSLNDFYCIQSWCCGSYDFDIFVMFKFHSSYNTCWKPFADLRENLFPLAFIHLLVMNSPDVKAIKMSYKDAVTASSSPQLKTKMKNHTDASVIASTSSNPPRKISASVLPPLHPVSQTSPSILVEVIQNPF